MILITYWLKYKYWHRAWGLRPRRSEDVNYPTGRDRMHRVSAIYPILVTSS